MYSKEQIINILTDENHFVDNFIVDAFLKSWKIEPVFEDENGVEFYDGMTIEKIKFALEKSQPQSSKIKPEVKPEPQVMPESVSQSVSAQPLPEPEIAPQPVQQTPTMPQIRQEQKPQPTSQIEPKVEVVEELKELPQIENVEQIPFYEIIEKIQETSKPQPTKEITAQDVSLDTTNQALNMIADSLSRKITDDISEFLKRSDFIAQAINAGSFKRDNEILANKIEEIIKDNKLLIKKIKELEANDSGYYRLFGNVYMKR